MQTNDIKNPLLTPLVKKDKPPLVSDNANITQKQIMQTLFDSNCIMTTHPVSKQYSITFHVILLYETNGCILLGVSPVVAVQLRG